MNCNHKNIPIINDDDYGFFYDIEDEYKKDISSKHHNFMTPHRRNNFYEDKKNVDKCDKHDKSEILYKGANYFLGIVTFCITVVSLYEVFS